MVEIMKSPRFWKEMIVPRLPATLANDPRAEGGVRIDFSNVRDVGLKQVAEYHFEIRHGGEAVFDAFREALPIWLRTRHDQEQEDAKLWIEMQMAAAEKQGDARRQEEFRRLFDAQRQKRADPKLFPNAPIILEVKKP